MNKYKKLSLEINPNAYSRFGYNEALNIPRYFIIYCGNYNNKILATGNNLKNAWANAYFKLKKQ